MTPEDLRGQALTELGRFGIKGPNVYLIDVIPLIEMIWADGKAQRSEISILKRFLKRHVDHINKMAGYEILSLMDAEAFLTAFLNKRPDPELLRTLRNFISPVRLSSSDAASNAAIKQSLLAACLDIASSAVTEYPYGIDERFNTEEKKCFFEILESFLAG